MCTARLTLPAKIADNRYRNFVKWASLWSLGVSTALLAGCASNASLQKKADDYFIDASVHSANQDSRVRTLIMHYTALPLDKSLTTLTRPDKKVSAHYLVPEEGIDKDHFRVYELVPESCRAWHAGFSYWQGERMLNAGSIGIEIVNLGFDQTLNQAANTPLMERAWYPYTDAQIAVIGELAAKIVARHGILPQKVIGHSDIAPGRKSDPGPLFPWQILYEKYHVGAWPDAEAVDYYRNNQPFENDIAVLQKKLLAYGYDTPQNGNLDQATIAVITAFQMHFRPKKYDGVPDVETVAILDALLEKYFRRSRNEVQKIALGIAG